MRVAFCSLPLLVTLAQAQAEPPPGMVLVPAGEFVMGCEDGLFDEAPAHRVRVSAFYIDRCEVTNAEFAAFVRETGGHDAVEGPWFRCSVEGCRDLLAHYRRRFGGDSPDAADGRDAARWRAAILALRDQVGEESQEVLVSRQREMPVRYVTWRDAVAYAHWAGKRLPTEAEWEKAARGVDGRMYPWGDRWDPARCRIGVAPSQAAVFDPYRFEPSGSRSADGLPPGPVAVGRHPEGASPYGVLDMAGNVWEWTADWYGERYYRDGVEAFDPKGPEGLPDGRLPDPHSEDALLRDPAQGRENHTRKVIRGGGWSGPAGQSAFNARTTRRLWSNPSYWHDDVGFRCAKDLPR